MPCRTSLPHSPESHAFGASRTSFDKRRSARCPADFFIRLQRSVPSLCGTIADCDDYDDIAASAPRSQSSSDGLGESQQRVAALRRAKINDSSRRKSRIVLAKATISLRDCAMIFRSASMRSSVDDLSLMITMIEFLSNWCVGIYHRQRKPAERVQEGIRPLRVVRGHLPPSPRWLSLSSDRAAPQTACRARNQCSEGSAATRHGAA